MRRHSRPGDEPAKKRLRKTVNSKRGDPPKAARRRNSSATSPETQVARLTRELQMSLAREDATSKVLEVISSSLGDLKPVFEAILENAVRLCGAKYGNLWLREGDGFRVAAMHNAPPAYTERRTGIVKPSPNSTPTLWEAVKTKQPAQIADMTKLQAYVEGDSHLVSSVSLGGYRGVLCVPIPHEDELIGVITILRQEAGAFADRQIELVANFAKQAVIAIENARLFNELRQRTADLTQSLERQTATSEILASISGSMTNAKPVFDAIIRNLLRLFGTRFAVVQLMHDGIIHIPALDGEPGFERLARHYPRPIDEMTAGGQAMLAKEVVHWAPVIGNPATPAVTIQFALDYGFNSVIAAPMIREGKVIGAIVTARRDATPFDDKAVALIKSFAAQAVIAIENARLFEAEQQRSRELSESLEQQTATSEVLRVISSSPGELEPVFQAMLENATRICEAKFGTLFRFDGDNFHPVAQFNTPTALLEAQMQRGPFKPHQAPSSIALCGQSG
jgi:two-component system, NtrC family, sensor kinase